MSERLCSKCLRLASHHIFVAAITSCSSGIKAARDSTHMNEVAVFQQGFIYKVDLRLILMDCLDILGKALDLISLRSKES